MAEFNHHHLDSVLRHIKLVQEATQLLGKRLIECDEQQFGLALIANGLRHDQSKLQGIEWDFLVRVSNDDDKAKEYLQIAWRQHVETNPHHPEFWPDGIHHMPRIYIAEMVCDCFARSQELGTDFRRWIKDDASNKYGFSLNGKVYKQMKYFVDLLLEPEFKPMKKGAEEKAASANPIIKQ